MCQKNFRSVYLYGGAALLGYVQPLWRFTDPPPVALLLINPSCATRQTGFSPSSICWFRESGQKPTLRKLRSDLETEARLDDGAACSSTTRILRVRQSKESDGPGRE